MPRGAVLFALRGLPASGQAMPVVRTVRIFIAELVVLVVPCDLGFLFVVLTTVDTRDADQLSHGESTMRTESLIVSCALLSMIVCPCAEAQQLAPSSAYVPRVPGRFTQLPETYGQPMQGYPGAGIRSVAFVEAANETPLAAGISGYPEPAPAFAATWQPGNYVVPAHAAAFGSEQTYDAIACESGCKGECCCPPAWAHRTSVFGELLYLRPRDSEIAFALPVDGAIPFGPVGVLDQDYSAGFRAGFSFALDDCTSLVATYSQLESSTFNFIDTNPALALRALLLHPATANAATDFLTASGNYDIDFQLVDADYRSVLFAGDRYAVNYSVGARYAHLDQDLRVVYTDAGTTDTVVTDLDFDGAGFRLGLDAERHTSHHGFLCYGKAFASFVGGEFRADYDHGSTVDPSIVDTAWRAGRVVTMLDLELGVGWQSPCGHYRVTAGYVFSAWLNTVNTNEWINTVRNNNFVELSDSMSFDGLTTRAEYRF